jgi:hypothetical protein
MSCATSAIPDGGSTSCEQSHNEMRSSLELTDTMYLRIVCYPSHLQCMYVVCFPSHLHFCSVVVPVPSIPNSWTRSICKWMSFRNGTEMAAFMCLSSIFHILHKDGVLVCQKGTVRRYIKLTRCRCPINVIAPPANVVPCQWRRQS